MPEPITPDQLNAIPLEHRRTLALWLTQRSDTYTASWLLTEDAATNIRRALVGAAVDLADPPAEDTTVGHAAQVLAKLGPPPARTPEPAWHLGCTGCWRTLWHPGDENEGSTGPSYGAGPGEGR